MKEYLEKLKEYLHFLKDLNDPPYNLIQYIEQEVKLNGKCLCTQLDKNKNTSLRRKLRIY